METTRRLGRKASVFLGELFTQFLDRFLKHSFTPFNENLSEQAPLWEAAETCLVKGTAGFRAGQCTWGTRLWGSGMQVFGLGSGIVHPARSGGRGQGAKETLPLQ